MARSARVTRRGAGQHRPGLRDRVDLALVVLRRAQRRAVVVVAAPVPLAVPGLLQHAGQPAGLARVARGPRRVAAASHSGDELAAAPCAGTSPSQTLSPRPWRPTRFMPSFQSPLPISGQAVGAGGQALVDGAHAVLEERGRFGRDPRLAVRPPSRPAARSGASRNGTTLVEDAVVAGRADVVRDGVGQPEQVVGAAGAQCRGRAGSCHQCCTSPFEELPARGAERGARGAGRAARATAP